MSWFERRINLLLLLLLLGGFLVRLSPLLHDRIFFWFDEGLDTMLVRQLVVDHKFALVSRYSAQQGVLMGPLWTWIMAVPFTISSGNLAANVVFLSSLNLISSYLTFSFLRKCFSFSSALITLVLTVAAPIYIFSSQVAASPHVLTFLFICYVWSLYECLVNDKKICWIPLLLLLGLFFQFEIGFALFILPSLFVSVILFKRWRSIFNKYFFAGVLLASLTFIPQVLFDFRHNFLISKGLLELVLGRQQNLYTSALPFSQRMLERWGSFREDFIRMAVFVEPGPVMMLAFGLIVTGWYLAVKRRLRGEINLLKLLIIILVTFYAAFCFYKGPFWTWYRAGLPIVFILLLGIPLGIMWDQLKLARFLITGLILVFIWQGINPQKIKDDLTDTPINDNAFLENQERALDFVYLSASGRKFSYFAYTPPVYDYIWQYNFWKYGRDKYGYLPGNWQASIPLLGIGKQSGPPKTDEGVFYLILEPNPDRPWEPDGWKESFIKVGEILESKTFPGNVTVEKRTTYENP